MYKKKKPGTQYKIKNIDHKLTNTNFIITDIILCRLDQI